MSVSNYLSLIANVLNGDIDRQVQWKRTCWCLLSDCLYYLVVRCLRYPNRNVFSFKKVFFFSELIENHKQVFPCCLLLICEFKNTPNVRNRTELNLIFFLGNLISRSLCFQEWPHTVSSSGLPCCHFVPRRASVDVGEEAVLLGTVPRACKLLYVILESQSGDNQIFICCCLFVQFSILGLTAAVSIDSYLCNCLKGFFLKYKHRFFSTFSSLDSATS